MILTHVSPTKSRKLEDLRWFKFVKPKECFSFRITFKVVWRWRSTKRLWLCFPSTGTTVYYLETTLRSMWHSDYNELTHYVCESLTGFLRVSWISWLTVFSLRSLIRICTQYFSEPDKSVGLVPFSLYCKTDLITL